MAADPVTTPQLIPLPSTANLVNPVDGSFLTFPPFPKSPESVKIMPFKKFKEGGICVEAGTDEAEVDTLGIPTVPIRTRHSTDQCKSKSKRKMPEDAKGKKGKKGKLVEQRLWWEQWEDAEAMRFCTGFNPYASDYEKIIAAAADFTSGRVWPVNFASESGPKFVWEKFQRYLGVQEGAAVPSAKEVKAIEEDEADFDDDEMDEDEDGEDGEDVGPGIIPDPVTGVIDVKNVQVPDPGKPKQPTVEQKLKAFFNDPEKSIKIFMSSYSRSMGYIWANANLDCIPRVIHYFVNFLLRSKVLPQIERELRRSLEVIALAIIELPNTSNIAKTFPDKFSLACNACWGQKADGYMTLATSEEEPVDSTMEEPEAKRQKCDTDIAQHPAPIEPEKETPVETTDTWGAGGDGDWGAAAEGSYSWGQNIAVIEENSAWASLQVDKPENLHSLLGPTVLPLTHSPGIVERSMRRIVSITRPPSSVAKSPPLPDGICEPNADAVELELGHRFAKVVLAPMIDWDGGESPVYTKPAILATSRGAVVVQDSHTPASPTPVQGGPQPHNPASDEITVLIDDIASQIDYLREGMAIGGTWVQLVRQGEPVVAKKKKGKTKKSSYWYLDELAIVVPSFWTIDD